jgi:hypothetical protein
LPGYLGFEARQSLASNRVKHPTQKQLARASFVQVSLPFPKKQAKQFLWGYLIRHKVKGRRSKVTGQLKAALAKPCKTFLAHTSPHAKPRDLHIIVDRGKRFP